MPPTEAPMSADMPAGGSAPADMASASGGEVMISMPKQAFDMMHQLVTQLASGLDQLKQGIDSQAGAVAPAASPAGPAMPEGQMSDEDFLNQIASQGTR